MSTKGFAVRLGDPYSGREPWYVAAETRGRAVSLVVQSAREHLHPGVDYGHVVSANRYPCLDGKREGFHERVYRRLANGVWV
jgi:hypothetical protein